MKNALDAKSVKIVESFDNLREKLGEFNIRFLNGEYKKPIFKFGENVNSVVTLVEKDGKKAVLAGDMNYKNGGERKIAKEIGKVDFRLNKFQTCENAFARLRDSLQLGEKNVSRC